MLHLLFICRQSESLINMLKFAFLPGENAFFFSHHSIPVLIVKPFFYFSKKVMNMLNYPFFNSFRTHISKCFLPQHQKLKIQDIIPLLLSYQMPPVFANQSCILGSTAFIDWRRSPASLLPQFPRSRGRV